MKMERPCEILDDQLNRMLYSETYAIIFVALKEEGGVQILLSMIGAGRGRAGSVFLDPWFLGS